MTKQQLENLVDDAITDDVLADYLTAPWGHRLGVYPDGHASVGEDVGREIDPGERPVAVAKCPGLANLDLTHYCASFARFDRDRGAYVVDRAYAFEAEHGRVIGDAADVIRECCRDGDVSGEREDLIARLMDSLEDGDGN